MAEENGVQSDSSIPKILPTGVVDADTLKKMTSGMTLEKVPESSQESIKGIDLDKVSTVDISSLSAEEQAKYRAMLDEATTSMEVSDSEEAEDGTDDKAKDAGSAAVNKSTQLCPNCSWDQSCKDVVEVTEDDKKMWLRHIISGTRFIKRYELFGKKVVVVLRSRTVIEQDMIMQQLAEDQKALEDPLTPQLYLYWWSRYALAGSLQSIQYYGKPIQTFPEIVSLDNKRAYENEGYSHYSSLAYVAKDKLANWNDTVHNSVLACQQHFDQLCARLQFQARSEDFFDDIGGEGF